MKKYFFYIQILLLTISQGQNIEVFVLDSKSLVPLKNANILLINDKNEFGGSTNDEGKYFFSDINMGNYELSVSFIGYETFTKNILINSKTNFNLQCPLIVKPILIPELEIISDVNQSYQKLAGSASIIKKETLKQINPIGTQEILEYVPGITAFSDDGIGNARISIGIRGLNPRRSSRVLILEDGIPIQPALYVYPNMYYNPPVERIDGIQVIKGSGTVKYGPQTMGGVVNYYTNRPSNDFEGNVKLIAGENMYSSLFTELNGFGTKKFKHAIQILNKQGDGFRDNNSFKQLNGTYKSNYNISDKKNIYFKLGANYENSNATYTGLTEYSFENDPNFNPKEHDNFKIFRTSFDLIQTEKINSKTKKTKKIFASYFDRKWWRENDIFILASDYSANTDNPDFQSPDEPFDLVRTGNGTDNFGILRTFYVLGLEQAYSLNSQFIKYPAQYDYGIRIYWERFIDDKKIGDSPNARDGIYYEPADICEVDLDTEGNCDQFNDLNGNNEFDEFETVVGQSHHYETTALSGYLSNSINIGSLTLNAGLRLEIFEQERIDRLNGASYLDQTTLEVLPSLSFIQEFNSFSIFGGMHRGYTAPSSGALKVTNFVPSATDEEGLDLKSEKSWNKELGIRTQNLFSILNLEFSIFHIDIEDMVAAGRGTKFENLGKVNSMGSELSALIKLSKFSLLPNIHISHTFLKTRIKDGILEQYNFISTGPPISINENKLPYCPTNILLIGLEKTLFNRLSMRFDYKYVDKVFTDFHNLDETYISNLGIRGPVPSYQIINASMNYNLTNKINITINAKNLTDEIYIGSRLHSNPAQNAANMSSGIIPGPRRQINFGIHYAF